MTIQEIISLTAFCVTVLLMGMCFAQNEGLERKIKALQVQPKLEENLVKECFNRGGWPEITINEGSQTVRCPDPNFWKSL